MFDTPYDFLSIMHYSRKAYAKNRKKETLTPFENVVPIGQRTSKNQLLSKLMLKELFLNRNERWRCFKTQSDVQVPWLQF